MKKRAITFLLNEKGVDKFLHEINFQLWQFSEKITDFYFQKLKNDVVRLMNKCNSLNEALDYRRLDYQYFEKSMEKIKIDVLNFIEKIPEYFF